MSIWREILEDEGGSGSSTRAAVLVGVLVGAIVVLILASAVLLLLEPEDANSLTLVLTALGAIITSFFAYCGAGYGMAKFSDNSVKKAGLKPDSISLAISSTSEPNKEDQKPS